MARTPTTVISIHALLAESDGSDSGIRFITAISIHALLAESDASQTNLPGKIINFYPRSPCGERHPAKSESLTTYLISIHALLAESDREKTSIKPIFSISIHALLAESDSGRPGTRPHGAISIHALLAESDCMIHPRFWSAKLNFYPRSPCGERQPATSRNNKNNIFLSTLSLRRATQRDKHHPQREGISIHALLAESDESIGTLRTVSVNFYPRSPCGERPVMHNIIFVPGKFLSTLSLRRATWPGLLARPFFIISIHALLAESDLA